MLSLEDSQRRFSLLPCCLMSESNLYELRFFNIDSDEEFRSYLAGSIDVERTWPDSFQNQIPGNLSRYFCNDSMCLTSMSFIAWKRELLAFSILIAVA